MPEPPPGGRPGVPLSRTATLLGAAALVLATTRVPAGESPAVIRVTVETAAGAHTVQAEVACTLDERAQGLMGRRSLAPDSGMIFLLPTPRPMRMWMKDTPLALDLIFFDSAHSIMRIERDAEAMSERVIESGGPVAGVLEIAGGRAQELGIAARDMVLYTYPRGRYE